MCIIGAAIYHSLKPPCPHCHRDNALIPIKSVETGHTPSYWRKDHNDKWGQAYKVSKDVTYQCRFCGHCTLYEETEEKSLD